MRQLAAVILAAGKGTRMKSRRPKVLHAVAGRPMLTHVLEAVRAAGADRLVAVVGHEADLVRQSLAGAAEWVDQAEQLGTGHALLQARPLLDGQTTAILVACGDSPLLTPETLRCLYEHHHRTEAALTLLTSQTGDPTGMGRVVRASSGRAIRIVEEKEASADELAIQEFNVGVYCFDERWLWPALTSLRPSSVGEVFLTDLVAAASQAGRRVETVEVADPSEPLGVNTRVQLAEAERVLRQRILERLMLDGVTIVDPATTYVEAGVQIGIDTVLHPGTTLRGETRVGEGCEIGPGTVVDSSTIGANCRVVASVIEESVLEDGVDVGPFSHLRPGAYAERGVHIGNFVEIKQSHVGGGSKIGHFSYVGDATLGRDVNIGAGTVTVNFDGQRKHPTVIGDGAFIGSATMLRAPVRIGVRAKTGAGSVVTRDVPDGAVAFGVPARVQGPQTVESPGEQRALSGPEATADPVSPGGRPPEGDRPAARE